MYLARRVESNNHIFTFFTASRFFSFLSEFNSDFSSNISPFLVVVKYLESDILIQISWYH